MYQMDVSFTKKCGFSTVFDSFKTQKFNDNRREKVLKWNIGYILKAMPFIPVDVADGKCRLRVSPSKIDAP